MTQTPFARLPLAACMAALVLSACSTVQPPAPAPTPTPTPTPVLAPAPMQAVALLPGLQQAPVVVQAALPATAAQEPERCVGGPLGLKLPADLRQVRTLGKLVREQAGEVESSKGGTATRKTLVFDGLELGVVEYSNDPARLTVTRAIVDGVEWNSVTPFKVGQPVSAARQLLGAAAADDPELRKPYAGNGYVMQVQSFGGVVTRVMYQCYSG